MSVGILLETIEQPWNRCPAGGWALDSIDNTYKSECVAQEGTHQIRAAGLESSSCQNHIVHPYPAPCILTYLWMRALVTAFENHTARPILLSVSMRSVGNLPLVADFPNFASSGVGGVGAD